MKDQTQKFQIGDIIVNNKNKFRRIIRDVDRFERDGISKVLYIYSDEEIDHQLEPTGNFKQNVTRSCGQDQLLRWQKGG